MSYIFQAACHRTVYACGCSSWDEWDGGGWVRKSAQCLPHEIAAARADG